MSTFAKIIITCFCILLLGAIGIGLYSSVLGNYLVNASFITIGLIILGLALLLAALLAGLRRLWSSVALLAVVAVSQGCNYAKSNQQVVVSSDCGMTWKKIAPGDAVPKGTGNYCFMKVVMPNYAMQGDSRFVTNLKDRVRANVHIDYDYSITEPLAFIKQAKYLGKANADADSDEALNQDAFEGAENTVIDKRIRDVSKAMFLQEDIVELDQADLENRLLTASNEVLQPFGVHLNFITLTFDLDEQTRQAIDISTAMKIYDSKGLSDIGKQVMSARAGAPKIIIENKAPEQVRAEQD